MLKRRMKQKQKQILMLLVLGAVALFTFQRYGHLILPENPSPSIVSILPADPQQPQRQLVGPHAPCEGGLLLTFDDGVNKETDVILDALSELQMKAMFFPIGSGDTGSDSSRLRRIVDEGHVLGCQGQYHTDNTKMTDTQFLNNLYLCGATFAHAVPEFRCKYYRSPSGSITVGQKALLVEHGVVYVPWDVDTQDWKNDAHGSQALRAQLSEQVTQQVLRERRTKYIVLMHNTKWMAEDGSKLILNAIQLAVTGRPAQCIANPETYFLPAPHRLGMSNLDYRTPSPTEKQAAAQTAESAPTDTALQPPQLAAMTPAALAAMTPEERLAALKIMPQAERSAWYKWSADQRKLWSSTRTEHLRLEQGMIQDYENR